MWDSAYNSHYNSLQLNLERRLLAGLSVVTNYTWAKTIDDYGATRSVNRRFDYGPSDDDVRHVFKFANVWEIPRVDLHGWSSKLVNGWALNSIVFWRSGFPFSIYSGRDNSLSGVAADRADFLGGAAQLSNGRSHGEMIDRFFDTSKFVPNTIGTFGNSGKNVMRGPRLFRTRPQCVQDDAVHGNGFCSVSGRVLQRIQQCELLCSG